MRNSTLQNTFQTSALECRWTYGMGIKSRAFQGFRDFRYGFNGKEFDSETSTQDYGMRIYDGRLGRFLSIDPLNQNFPWYAPYQFAGNTPIQAIDLDGMEEKYVITSIGLDGKTHTEIKTYKELHPNSKATNGIHGTGSLHMYYTSDGELQGKLTHYDKSFGDIADDLFNFGIMIWGAAANSDESLARKLRNPKLLTTVDNETLNMINLMRKQDKYKAPSKPGEAKQIEGAGKGAAEAMKTKDEIQKAKTAYPHPTGDVSGIIKPLSGEKFNGKELWYTVDNGDKRKHWIATDNMWQQVDIENNKVIGTFIPETKTVLPPKFK